jgi:putative tryptophan/tyrosine transport system substrate-binding protein
MRRRDFIAGLGSAVAFSTIWPLASLAQQTGRMRRVGMLLNSTADNPRSQLLIAVFLQGLQPLGWTVGRNLHIDFRWTSSDADRVRRYATELVALALEVIVTSGSSHLGPLLEATHTVPIVFIAVTDPVGAGFVASLARPGGNATGFTTYEYGISPKWLELLKAVAPGVTRAAVIRDPANRTGTGQFGAIQGAAPSFGVEVSAVGVRDSEEIESYPQGR